MLGTEEAVVVGGSGPRAGVARQQQPDPNAALVAENERLVWENAKFMRNLRRTEAIRDVQKTLCQSARITGQ